MNGYCVKLWILTHGLFVAIVCADIVIPMERAVADSKEVRMTGPELREARIRDEYIRSFPWLLLMPMGNQSGSRRCWLPCESHPHKNTLLPRLIPEPTSMLRQ